MYAIVDDEDYEYLDQWKWYVSKRKKTFYAMRNISINGKKAVQRMHRFIMSPPKEMQIDHINSNGLDNRKSNLRICTNQQNQQNRHHVKSGTSRFKGVYWEKKSKKWVAHIRFNYKRIYLGCSCDEEGVARLYDKKAKELFGEFACLNFKEAIPAP